jgi:hypothetical protein
MIRRLSGASDASSRLPPQQPRAASGSTRLGVERLPGTIRWKPFDDVSVVVPIGLMIVVSIVATVVLNLIFRR